MTNPNISFRQQQLRAFISRVWDAGDAEAAGDYLAPTYVIHYDPGDPWEGRTLDLSAFKDRVRQSRAAFPDQAFDIQGLFAGDGSIAMSWLWSGTHLGDLPGYPASGKTVRMSGATVYMFDDADRLTGHWQVTDRLSVYQQLQRHAGG